MDKFADISTEDLTASREEKFSAFNTLVEMDAPTPAQIEEAAALADEIDAIDAECAARTAAAAEAAAKFQALKSRTFGVEEASMDAPAEEDEEDEEPEMAAESVEAAVEDEPAEEPPVEAEAEVSEPVAETAPVAAATKSVAEMASRTTRPVLPKKDTPMMSLTAATEVPGFSAGQKMEGFSDLAKALMNKSRGFARPTGTGTMQKFQVASFDIPVKDGHVVNRPEEALEVFSKAANEYDLPGGSLVAATGWCSPSETMYDLRAEWSLDGMVSIPEVQVNRGGIRWTTGPQFSDFYADTAVNQFYTEAQIIAGVTKEFVEVTCPAFTDTRLDAVPLGVKIPFLMEAAYPEMVEQTIQGSLVAHQHRVNANVIGRMVAIAGAAKTVAGLGSTVDDTLEALERVAEGERQRYRLPLDRSLEVVVPFWVRAAMRADLARRNGVDKTNVSDADLNAHFAARNLAVQWVYDWQDLPLVDDAGTVGVDEATTYPATFNALVYPSGTYVKGVSDVVNISAVYDAASLAENTYTGMFMEQGLLVVSQQYTANLLTLPICNAGRTGAANLTCA